MKQLLAFALFALSAITLRAQNIESLAVGSTAPMAAQKMKSIDGKEFSIKDVTQKNGVLVMFSCNTCPYVVKYQARTLNAIKQAKENGFGIIIINSNEAQRTSDDSYSAMQSYAKAQQYTNVNVPYVIDKNSAVANAFGATRTPECFLFNNKGVLVYHGAIDDNQDASQAKRQHLFEALHETVAGKDVTVKESRSVGCSIKRVM